MTQLHVSNYGGSQCAFGVIVDSGLMYGIAQARGAS